MEMSLSQASPLRRERQSVILGAAARQISRYFYPN